MLLAMLLAVSAAPPTPPADAAPQVSAGAYIDSYRKVATMIGAGVDIGRDYGVGLTVAHVDGSDMECFPVVPLPSLFYRSGEHGVRIICAPDATAFAFGYTYTLKP